MLIGERGRIRADHLANGVPRQPQFAADPLDRPPLRDIARAGPARSYPLRASPTRLPFRQGSHCDPNERGPDWMPITPKRGLHIPCRFTPNACKGLKTFLEAAQTLTAARSLYTPMKQWLHRASTSRFSPDATTRAPRYGRRKRSMSASVACTRASGTPTKTRSAATSSSCSRLSRPTAARRPALRLQPPLRPVAASASSSICRSSSIRRSP